MHATDGRIGHIDDFLVDETLGRVCFLVVDTSNWLGGKWVAIPPTSVSRIDWGENTVYVSMTREAIRRSPTMEEAQVPSVEMTPPFVII